MRIEYGITGPDRKMFVAAIGDILETKPKYLGMPSAAYQIGGYTVTKDGALESEEDGIKDLVAALAEKGFQAPLPAEDEPAEGLTVSVPLGSADIGKLKNLLETKGSLIKKSLGVPELPIEIRFDNTLAFPWFAEVPDPDTANAATELISALCKASLESKRVSSKDRGTDNEKYTFRCFLLRLGFIGKEYQGVRKALLKNLDGNAAFKGGKKDGVE